MPEIEMAQNPAVAHGISYRTTYPAVVLTSLASDYSARAPGCPAIAKRISVSAGLPYPTSEARNLALLRIRSFSTAPTCHSPESLLLLTEVSIKGIIETQPNSISARIALGLGSKPAKRRSHEQSCFYYQNHFWTEHPPIADAIRSRGSADAGRMNPSKTASVGAAVRFADFEPLHAAEKKIIAELGSGDFIRIGNGLCPEGNDPGRIVRAELLRLLIIGSGSDLRLHEKGLRISGAQIVGTLDLEGCRIPRDITLTDCLFDASPVLRSAVIDNLFLDGSALPGLQTDRLEARGGLSICGATVTGEIRLRGGRVGGNIEADGAKIMSPDGVALDANGLEARGGILLRGAEVHGGIDLSGVRLGGDVNGAGARIERPGGVALNGGGIGARGDLAFRGATVTGEIRLFGAHFGGDIDCTSAILAEPEGYALRLNRARVDGAFFLRQGASVLGTLDLTAAAIGAIYDEEACWPSRGDLLLNRCRYGALIGGPIDATSRLGWLARQLPERWQQDFWPQPYEQLSTVLREMGHDEEARAVLIVKERLQRRARRARAKNPLLRAALAISDGTLAVTLGYGRQPLLALLWLILFWGVGVVVFSIAEQNSALKPNSAIVLRSLEWTMCAVQQTERRYMPSAGQVLAGRASSGQTQLSCFLSQPEAASYPEFNPWMYSLDALLPVMEIGQKQYWRPDPSKPMGLLTLNYYYFLSVIGWALSLLAVAGFSGLVKSK